MDEPEWEGTTITVGTKYRDQSINTEMSYFAIRYFKFSNTQFQVLIDMNYAKFKVWRLNCKLCQIT